MISGARADGDSSRVYLSQIPSTTFLDVPTLNMQTGRSPSAVGPVGRWQCIRGMYIRDNGARDRRGGPVLPKAWFIELHKIRYGNVPFLNLLLRPYHLLLRYIKGFHPLLALFSTLLTLYQFNFSFEGLLLKCSPYSCYRCCLPHLQFCQHMCPSQQLALRRL
jgi:hypothetical protein